MGKYHGEQATCFDHKAPGGGRLKEERKDFDPSTGNAARDGYTATGTRRPIGRKPGDMVDKETADSIERFEKEMEKYGGPGAGALYYDD